MRLRRLMGPLATKFSVYFWASFTIGKQRRMPTINRRSIVPEGENERVNAKIVQWIVSRPKRQSRNGTRDNRLPERNSLIVLQMEPLDVGPVSLKGVVGDDRQIRVSQIQLFEILQLTQSVDGEIRQRIVSQVQPLHLLSCWR